MNDQGILEAERARLAEAERRHLQELQDVVEKLLPQKPAA